MKPPREQIDLKSILMLDGCSFEKFRRLIPHRVSEFSAWEAKQIDQMDGHQ
jgi:hypothetical protein